VVRDGGCTAIRTTGLRARQASRRLRRAVVQDSVEFNSASLNHASLFRRADGGRGRAPDVFHDLHDFFEWCQFFRRGRGKKKPWIGRLKRLAAEPSGALIARTIRSSVGAPKQNLECAGPFSEELQPSLPRPRSHGPRPGLAGKKTPHRECLSSQTISHRLPIVSSAGK
jgi:hypothetical protein